MHLEHLYPMPLVPVYKSYLWGGNKIATLRNLSQKSIAESWEVVDREKEQSIVAEGPYKGKRVQDLLGEDLLGHNRHYDRFPILIKLIDAAKHLSIQVHPDEKAAKLYNGEAKNEIWYILDCKDKVLAGLKEGIDQDTFEKAIEEKKIEELFQYLTIKPKDLIYIPAGRVHAILAGTFLLEVQQNSDTTYRIYDWDRKDNNGNIRALHIPQALGSIHWKDNRPFLIKKKKHQTPYFFISAYDVDKKTFFYTERKSCEIYFLFEGKASIVLSEKRYPMAPFRAYLIPAKADCIEIIPEKPSHIVRITL